MADDDKFIRDLRCLARTRKPYKLIGGKPYQTPIGYISFGCMAYDNNPTWDSELLN